jgi:hypothetical protein
MEKGKDTAKVTILFAVCFANVPVNVCTCFKKTNC